jgi:hypothetical protein
MISKYLAPLLSSGKPHFQTLAIELISAISVAHQDNGARVFAAHLMNCVMLYKDSEHKADASSITDFIFDPDRQR